MDFQRLVKSVQKLKEVDEELCMQLRNYVYPLVGACPFGFAQGKQEVLNQLFVI